MSFKCPDCGATLTDDSRFCKYCGAKIDDGVKRSEVKIDINKRIEDVAEVKRAGYEEQESLLRQKILEKELRKGRIRKIILLVIFGIGFGMYLWGKLVTHTVANGIGLTGIMIVVCEAIYLFFEWFHKIVGG